MGMQALSWWYKSTFAGLSLAGLYALEQQWPLLGLGLFVIFSLTLGMGHGALDVVLLLGQFKPRSRAMFFGAIYLALTLMAGWLLSLSFAWALVVLLVMSVWHFGEVYAERLLLRLAVGGASLMAPLLLQKTALSQLLQGIANQDLPWLLNVWSGLAWAWVVLVALVLLASVARGFDHVVRGLRTPGSPARAMLEIGMVGSLSLVFSPLLQFAIYFGLYHCTTHIARVHRATLHHPELPLGQFAGAWVASMVLTGILLAVLWNGLPGSGTWIDHVDAHMVHWLVVALGAVTVPHLILVSYSGRWLGR